jgi:hypothetical protein
MQTITLINNPIVSTKIRIIKKRAYKQLTSCTPDLLGLTQVSSMQFHKPQPISLVTPTFRLLAKLNHTKIHAGVR